MKPFAMLITDIIQILWKKPKCESRNCILKDVLQPIFLRHATFI